MLNVPLQAIILSILIHTLWGGNPIAAKIGFEVFPPAWSAFIRFVLGIVTIAVCCFYSRHRLWPDKQEWLPMLWLGSLFTLQIFSMNIGFNHTSGVNAAVLISTNPLFAALFAHILINTDRLTTLKSAGLVIAFGGVCLTLLQTTDNNVSFGSMGDWICLASAGLLGFRLIVSANAMKRIDPFRLALWQMVFSLPVFAIIGIATETIHWPALSATIVYALLFQGVIVAGFGFMASLWLISRYQPSVMAGFNFLAPVSGVLLAAAILGESINTLVIAGTALVAVGMIMITMQRQP